MAETLGSATLKMQFYPDIRSGAVMEIVHVRYGLNIISVDIGTAKIDVMAPVNDHYKNSYILVQMNGPTHTFRRKDSGPYYIRFIASEDHHPGCRLVPKGYAWVPVDPNSSRQWPPIPNIQPINGEYINILEWDYTNYELVEGNEMEWVPI